MHNELMLEKHVNVLNESFINFLKQSLFIAKTSPSKANSFTMC